jgi:hypothetical protein
MPTALNASRDDCPVPGPSAARLTNATDDATTNALDETHIALNANA